MKKSHLIISLITIMILSGCATPKPIMTIPQNFQDTARPLAENIIIGLAKQDYALFSKDFDQKMIDAIPTTAMAEVHKLLWNQFGEYQTIQTKKFFEEKDYYVGLFNLIFEKGDIDMQVIFSQSEPYKVSGLWFPTN
jgi:PBP1b-binding outer membrane lipoprotein LpoB